MNLSKNFFDLFKFLCKELTKVHKSKGLVRFQMFEMKANEKLDPNNLNVEK